MKQDIRNKEPQERQAFVPASVEVIEITVQKVLCQSGGDNSTGFGDYNNGGSF